MNKLIQIILIPIATIFSYLIPPATEEGKEFEKLNFKERMKHYFKQILKQVKGE